MIRAPAAPCACSRVNTASSRTTRDATRASALQVRRCVLRADHVACALHDVFCERIKAVCLCTSTTRIKLARCYEQEVHEVIASHRFRLILMSIDY